MQRFTELKVWQRSHDLTLEVYRVTANFPSTERFGLISQLRRAAASIPANIAEGSKRQDSLKDILDLALEKRIMDKIIWESAQDIRKMANKAAHPETVLDEGLCNSAFDAMRGILQQRYE